MTEQKQPWESPLVEIIESYEAEIIGEEDSQYAIAFADYDGGEVEARVNRKEFENFPHPVGVGTYFGIVVYKENEKTKAGAWPVAKYWNEELRSISE